MATTSLWPIHSTGSRSAKAVVRQLVEYAENEKKTVQEKGGETKEQAMKSVIGYASQDKKVKPGAEDDSVVKTGIRVSGGGADPTYLSEPGGLEAESDDEAVGLVMTHLSDRRVGMRYVTGINCTPEKAVEEMMITKNRWPERGNRLLFHGYQSFVPGEVTPDQAHRLGVQLARELWGDRFEVVVATHLDREHLHNHFVLNTVSFLDGRKFNWDKEYPRMQRRSDELCRGESLSVVPSNGNLDRKIHRGARYAENEGKQSIQSIVKEDVDCCIREASTLEEWMELMRKKGYRIDDSRKYFRVFPYGHSKCIRLDRRFGEEYSLDGIAEQILRQETKMERREKTEEEAINEIYRSLVQRGRRRHKPAGKPRGIQKKYMRFLYQMGYHKSPAQIARTHYLLREELTKLDRYIEESKFLIYEDISTLDELKERQSQDQAEMNMLYRSRINLQRMLPVSNEVERQSAEGQLIRLEESIRKMRRNLRSEKGILKRMGEMDAKEKKVELVLSGKSFGKPYIHTRNHPAEKERRV